MSFKAGDRVLFKTWEEMAEQYGFTSTNEDVIDCQFNFPLVMDNEIDRDIVYTIDFVDSSGHVSFLEEEKGILPRRYSYSVEMIKPYEVSKEEKENYYDISPWGMHYSIDNHTTSYGIAGTKNFMGIIHTMFLDEPKLYLVSEILRNSLEDLIDYTGHANYYNVALYAIGYANFENIGEDFEYKGSGKVTFLGNEKVKAYHEDGSKTFILLVADRSTNFNDKILISDIVDYFSPYVPKENELMAQIIDCLKEYNSDGATIRDEYIKATEETRRLKKLYSTCDNVQSILVTERINSLKDKVNQANSYLEDIRRKYQYAVNDLNSSKKEYTYAKYNLNTEAEDPLIELLKADIKDGRLIQFDADNESLRFLIVEDLLFFDEDDWEKVKDGVIEESSAERYRPLLEAIFSRKCILTIEQGARLFINPVNSEDQVQRYVFGDVTRGVPNSHMQRFNCWDQNGANCYEYISSGDYALAYTQIKSAIAGINVTDNPVMIDFCSHIGQYRDIDCVRDSETGEVMTIEEANDYYAEM